MPKGGFKGGKGGGFKGGGFKGGGFKGGGFKKGFKGGHHGGHHGHHGHHGGGIIPGPVWWGGGYPWWGDGYSELVVTDPCPDLVDLVFGVDVNKYLNACKANQAGVAVAKKLGPAALKDYVTVGNVIPGVPNLALLAGAGLAAYMLFFRKKR